MKLGRVGFWLSAAGWLVGLAGLLGAPGFG